MAHTAQYIFGYGSLIDSQTRATTSPSALYASPANVAGIQRGWFGRLGDVGPTYLAAVPHPSSNCNGVIFEVSGEELAAFDKYEAGYERKRIDPDRITMLDDSKLPVDGDIWFYTCTEKCFASREFPILQSYVDTCLNGCFEIEAEFPRAKAAEFAEEFLKTSTNWSKYWENDRNSRMMTVRQSQAEKIDGLIKKVLGQEMSRTDYAIDRRTTTNSTD